MLVICTSSLSSSIHCLIVPSLWWRGAACITTAPRGGCEGEARGCRHDDCIFFTFPLFSGDLCRLWALPGGLGHGGLDALLGVVACWGCHSLIGR